ncbi:MAG: hypothetical protein PVS3B3_34450 [Ktedonobacteraceae bacterium]
MRPLYTLLKRFTKRFTLFFFAATFALFAICTFTAASATPAYASGGGCYSGYTDYPGAQIGDTDGYYGFSNDSPMVTANFNTCTDKIELRWKNSNHDFHQVRWIRPGMSQESQYQSEYSNGSNFSNAHYNTVYQFIVQGCDSHWYGSSCTNWSVRMYVHTNS